MRENGGATARDIGATRWGGVLRSRLPRAPGRGVRKARALVACPAPSPSRPPPTAPGRSWHRPSVLAAAGSRRQAGARPRSHPLRDAAGATATRWEASFASWRGRGSGGRTESALRPRRVSWARQLGLGGPGRGFGGAGAGRSTTTSLPLPLPRGTEVPAAPSEASPPSKRTCLQSQPLQPI